MDTIRLISNMRRAQKVSQKRLAYGLLSVPELSRFENGDNELPYAVTEALVQRLGKSCDKFTLQLSKNDYQLVLLQNLLVHSLLTRDQQFDQLCILYESDADMSYALHRQYLLMLRGARDYLSGNHITAAIASLTKAIEQTFPGWREKNWSEYLLCTQEVQILLLLAFLLLEEEEHLSTAQHILSELEVKIAKSITDEEEYARLYPQLCYLYASYAIIINDPARVKTYLDAGKSCICEHGILSLAGEFLELELSYFRNAEEILSQRNAFLHVFALAGLSVSLDVFSQFLSLNQHHEIILTHEVIHDTRSYKNLSQEELSFEICAAETLSRIESGKRRPQRKRLQRLFDRLQIDQRSFQIMDTDDYRLLELYREEKKKIFHGEFAEAEALFRSIREELDPSVIVNQQFLGQNEILFCVENGKKNRLEAVRELNSLLHLTEMDYQQKIYRVPSANEFEILLTIALYLQTEGGTDEARSLMENILHAYENSEVLEEHHAKEYVLIYINLTGNYGSQGRYENAKELALNGIRLASRCKRGDWIAYLLVNLVYTYGMSGVDKAYNETLQTADAMLSFYRMENGRRQLANMKDFFAHKRDS